MKRKRRRKGRLRYDRIFLVLFTFVALIFIIKLISYITYNNATYKTIINDKDNTVSINKKYSSLKIYSKTIEYIKENKKNVEINYKKYSIVLPSGNVSKKMNLKINSYNKRLGYDDFSHSKAYFIESEGIVSKSNKITVKLPNYLLKNEVVDIYGVTKDDQVEEIKLKEKIDDDKVSFKIDDKYSKYFITYVKLKYVTIKDKTVYNGDSIKLNIKYIPNKATIKDYEYTKIGDIFMLDDNNNLSSKNVGTDKITIKFKSSKIKEEVTIKVIDKDSNKPQIEVIDGLTYINGILIVNKTYSLPKDYNPEKINDEAYSAFEKMKEAAKKDNINLWIASGFRSYDTQDELYNYYLLSDPKEKVDTYSARPGHSEHQTGLAMDLNIIDSSFEGTPEAIWLDKNAYKYGFIIRYPKGKEEITGYKYEPWHVRYLGEEVAKKVYDSGLTLEEYLNIDSKYSE